MKAELKKFGKIVNLTGIVLLAMMAIIGTLSVDIVILAFLLKESKNRNGRNDFLTGMLIGMLWSNRGPHYHHRSNRDPIDPTIALVILVIASLIVSSIAVGLAFYLGVAEIGIALIAGWAIAAGVLLIGQALMSLADSLPQAGGTRAFVATNAEDAEYVAESVTYQCEASPAPKAEKSWYIPWFLSREPKSTSQAIPVAELVEPSAPPCKL